MQDLYLYYFLLRYPGRSIIFVNSIDSIRRLLPLFTLLQLPIFPLHSHLQQKQRLKNLDRFKSNPNGILIATDVAARGLDIPHVDHVVHFNLPRTADAYIHRSGRTARAQNEGFALQLVSPDEKSVQRALMKSLERTHELPDLSIEAGFLPSLRERLRVATEIEKAQHRATKATHDKNWLLEAAEAMDIDIDPSMLDGEDDDPDAPYYKPKKQDRSKGKASVENLKMELRALLQEKLVARGVSIRYPTSGSKVIVDDLIKSTGESSSLFINPIRQKADNCVRSWNVIGREHEQSVRPSGEDWKKKIGIGKIWSCQEEEGGGTMIISFLRHSCMHSCISIICDHLILFFFFLFFGCRKKNGETRRIRTKK